MSDKEFRVMRGDVCVILTHKDFSEATKTLRMFSAYFNANDMRVQADEMASALALLDELYRVVSKP